MTKLMMAVIVLLPFLFSGGSLWADEGANEYEIELLGIAGNELVDIIRDEVGDDPSRHSITESNGVVCLYHRDLGAHFLGMALRADKSLRTITGSDLQVICDSSVAPSDIETQRGYVGTRGLSVALLFDRSWVMEEALPEGRRIAGELLDQLRDEDQIYLACTSISRKPLVISDGWKSPGDRAQLQQVLTNKVTPIQFSPATLPSQLTSTHILDGMMEIINNMPSTSTPDEEPIERKILIVFSTMEDDTSYINVSDVKNAAIRENVTIVVITPSGKDYVQAVVDELTDVTGGTAWKGRAQLGRNDWRQQLARLSAPHLYVYFTIPESPGVPANGKFHDLSIVIPQRSNELQRKFLVGVRGAREFWVLILEIVVPIFLALLLISASVLVAKQRRPRPIVIQDEVTNLESELADSDVVLEEIEMNISENAVK